MSRRRPSRTKGLAARKQVAQESAPPSLQLVDEESVARNSCQSTEITSTGNPAKSSSKGKAKSKSTRPLSAAERRRRTDFALDQLRDGSPEREVLSALREELGLKRDVARRVIDAAYRELSQFVAGRPPRDQLHRAVMQRDEVARRAIEAGDLRTTLAALDGRDKLLGLVSGDALERDGAVQSLLDLARRAMAETDG